MPAGLKSPSVHASVMPTCKEVLKRHRWDPNRSMEGLLITYRHRGAPQDERTIPVDDVDDLGSSFVVTVDDTHIPYHRILRIERGDEAIWTRREDHG